MLSRNHDFRERKNSRRIKMANWVFVFSFTSKKSAKQKRKKPKSGLTFQFIRDEVGNSLTADFEEAFKLVSVGFSMELKAIKKVQRFDFHERD